MNELKVQTKQAIVALREQGWSKRKIARELGVDRATVRRALAAVSNSTPAATGLPGPAGVLDSKAAIPLTGSASELTPKPAISLTGSEGVCDPNAAIPLTGSNVVAT